MHITISKHNQWYKSIECKQVAVMLCKKPQAMTWIVGYRLCGTSKRTYVMTRCNFAIASALLERTMMCITGKNQKKNGAENCKKMFGCSIYYYVIC